MTPASEKNNVVVFGAGVVGFSSALELDSKASKNRHIVVLGAGVSGLSTALALLSSINSLSISITIIATHLPQDRSPEYTSPWAGGHWRSHVDLGPTSAPVRKWDARTYQHWDTLLTSSTSTSSFTEETLGLGYRPSRNYWGSHDAETANGDGSGLWWSKPGVVHDFRSLKEEERLDGAIMGIEYKSIAFDPPRYLAFLFEKIKHPQVKVIQATIDASSGLEGVVKGVKEILGDKEEPFCLVNCTGLAARKFVGEKEAAKLFPIRGQTILVKGEAKRVSTYTGVPDMIGSDFLLVVPRPGSGTTILGGCKQVGSWETEVDEELNERIFQGLKKYGIVREEDGLLNADGEFDVVAKQVGFRPGRKGGPRVEVEKEKVGGIWVVHSYGHGGGGFQASWGCAEEVVELIEGLSG